MKYLLLLLFVSLAFYACNKLDADEYNYRMEWLPNAEQDMSHYNTYVWVGTDTTQCPLFNGMPIGTTHSLYLQTVSHPDTSVAFPVESDGIHYVAGGVQAVDSSGRQSPMAFSGFVLTEDYTPPAMPQGVTLRRE